MPMSRKEEVLKGMLTEYNRTIDGGYFVNSKKEIVYGTKGSIGKICDLSEVESFGFSGEIIFLEANESWQLTDFGPEF